MEKIIEQRIEKWKKLLLDFSKRNRLYNFHATKRTNLEIVSPDFESLYNSIVQKNETLQFPYPVADDEEDDDNGIVYSISDADITVGEPKSIKEQYKSLTVLRQRAKSSFDEQGIHVLYLIFGLLSWKPYQNSDEEILSPLLLVPVQLTCENLTSPFRLELHDSEEVVLNPTLKHKLISDYNVALPDFDSNNDNLEEYFEQVGNLVSNLGYIKRSVHMTLLSFLKMSMYEDINKNVYRLSSNPHIRALCGASTTKDVKDGWNFDKFDHDNDTRPHDVFHILDADSSQMDAIMAAKRGLSFVLQGPPGTGKSQTIANIISESLADGKKVLFVSEKRAALEVVYKRLKNAGLGDFCFTLHDYKANRRQILGQLQAVMERATERTPALDVSQLNVLQRKRKELNRYHNDLHTPCSEYNMTMFDAIGRLAKLSDAPDVIFDIPNVEQLTPEYLEDKCDLLSRLASVIRKRSENYENNCWKYSIVENLTQTLRHDIDAHLLPMIPRLRSLNAALAAFNSKHENNLPYTVDSLPQYEEVFQVAAENPGVLSHWIEHSSIDDLTADSHKWEDIINEVKQKRQDLTSWYTQEFFEIEPAGYLDYLKAGADYLLSFFKVKEINSFIASLDSLVHEFSSIKISMDSIYEKAEAISVALGVERPKTRKELHQFVNLCEILKNLQATIPASWFEATIFAQVKQATPAYNHKHDRVRTIEKQIGQNFDRGIYELDYNGLLRRFRTEYGSVLRFFKPSYYKDLKEIRAHYKHSTGLKNVQIHNVLNSLKDRHALLDDFEAEKEQLSLYYGQHYKGVESNWSQIKDSVDNFGKIIELLTNVPDRLRGLLETSLLPEPELIHFLDDWQNIVPVKLYTRINDVCNEPIEQDKEYKDYSERYQQILDVASSFLVYYSGIAQLRKQGVQYTQVVQDIEELKRLRECEKEIEDNTESLTRCYGFYYRGMETDWASTRAALEYSLKLKKVVQKYDLSTTFIAHLCSDASVVQNCGELLKLVNNKKESITKDLRWFANLFPSEIEPRLFNRELLTLADYAEVCQLNKQQLEEWIDFRTQRQRCVAAGLESYVYHVENNKVPTEYIVEAYRKRFYVLWIDALKQKFPVLNRFRGNFHEDLINEFRTLDKLQFKIAVKRIQKKLWESLPDFRVSYSRNDEVTILKRELQKKTRLKALRRLFSEIPNLTMALKPCFMMSPLSVSVFLGSEAYNFDLVVFDEASQVHTEDAIGAIMRGKQVVIVGDDKQLPPTSFFKTTMSEDDYDVEDPDEFYDGASFESILTEAKASGFREHSLRWHYRSRQEDLIAFSNIKLYDGKLITFPSTTLKSPDCGVEFVHVADGSYERKKSKGTNPREAQKVAELVFEHFRKYGKNRSLGVVAFSESQQSAIEAAIIDYRRKNDIYEQFFNEDEEEAFFIKNLENVQGDERDTIIFSVGYAKDESGKMYMNFGPLNRVGGERRLNVAVTRAKHNVKLVASILPTDIDLERTKAIGVSLLRSYLEFAQQGVDALINEVTYNSQIIDCESPFEESVYDYLSTRGYQVQTQVGCSEYRIDMAVKHPTLKGKFAIGIECDGAAYHSSRTARERDRLRQTVLEDMGWTIYRIWSTDWIKSPESQGAKLEAAIRAAFEKNTVIPPIHPLSHTIDVVIDELQPPEPVATNPPIESTQGELGLSVSNEGNLYGFVDYEYAKLKPYWTQSHISTAITHIIGIEQPIHIYELAKRLLPLYNRQKVTVAFREEVEWELRKILATQKIQRNRDFLQYSNFTELKVRIPSSESTGRDIDYIPDEEIKLAFVEIAKKSYGILKDELIKIAANQFGFMRRGGKIMEAFETVYKSALRDKSLIEIEGKVSV